MNRSRILILGAIDGALYSAVTLVLVWQVRAYAYNRNVREAESFGHFPVQMTSNERWVPIVVIWIVMFGLAALLVNHFWRSSKSSVWFWEAIGLVAVATWNVFILSTFWLEKGFSGQGLSYAWATSSSNPIFGPISLGVVLIVNVLFAQAVLFFEKRVLEN
jgi:amino acid permease